MIKDNFTILNEYNISNFYSKTMMAYKENNKNNKRKFGFTDSSIVEVIKYYNLDDGLRLIKKLAEK